jgi:hypothetical protein
MQALSLKKLFTGYSPITNRLKKEACTLGRMKYTRGYEAESIQREIYANRQNEHHPAGGACAIHRGQDGR